MRQLMVELDEKEMTQLEGLGRQRCVDPAELLKAAAMENDAKEERRRARLAILMRSSGIFAGGPGKPKDGLIYQNELRAEWQ